MAATGMKIAMYNYSGDPRVINKSIPAYDPQGDNVFTAYLSTPCEIMHPTITIAYNGNLANGLTAKPWNYAYIPDWGRYYFVDDYTSNSAGKLTVDLSVDVLYTYRTNLLASPVTVVRWSGAGINFVHDDKFPMWNTRTKKIVHNLTPISADDGYLVPGPNVNNILIGLI